MLPVWKRSIRFVLLDVLKLLRLFRFHKNCGEGKNGALFEAERWYTNDTKKIEGMIITKNDEANWSSSRWED